MSRSNILYKTQPGKPIERLTLWDLQVGDFYTVCGTVTGAPEELRRVYHRTLEDIITSTVYNRYINCTTLTNDKVSAQRIYVTRWEVDITASKPEIFKV